MKTELTRSLLHTEGGPDNSTTAWAYRRTDPGRCAVAENVTTVVELCRQAAIIEPTFYKWEEKCGFGLSELREFRQLREENIQMKRLLVDLSLNWHTLQEIVQKKSLELRGRLALAHWQRCEL